MYLLEVALVEQSTRLSPWHLHFSWGEERPGCWARLHPERWLLRPGAYSTPHHSWGKNTPNMNSKQPLPDSQLEVPGNDPGLLVVPGSVASQLQDLSSEILHHSCHVDWCASSHPFGVVPLPGMYTIRRINQFRILHYLRSLWMRPTGNWSPALLERDLAFPFTLPPLPRPDISAVLL